MDRCGILSPFYQTDESNQSEIDFELNIDINRFQDEITDQISDYSENMMFFDGEEVPESEKENAHRYCCSLCKRSDFVKTLNLTIDHIMNIEVILTPDAEESSIVEVHGDIDDSDRTFLQNFENSEQINEEPITDDSNNSVSMNEHSKNNICQNFQNSENQNNEHESDIQNFEILENQNSNVNLMQVENEYQNSDENIRIHTGSDQNEEGLLNEARGGYSPNELDASSHDCSCDDFLEMYSNSVARLYELKIGIQCLQEELDKLSAMADQDTFSVDPCLDVAPNPPQQHVDTPNSICPSSNPLGSCIICCDNVRECAFIPCGHVACCLNCTYSTQLNCCPTCRAMIDCVQAIFVN